MKDNNLHSSHNYPDDLKYSDQNWEMALEGIKDHERSVFYKRVFGIGAAIAVLTLLFVLFQYNSNSIEAQWAKTNSRNIEFVSLNTNAKTFSNNNKLDNASSNNPNSIAKITSNENNKVSVLPNEKHANSAEALLVNNTNHINGGLKPFFDKPLSNKTHSNTNNIGVDNSINSANSTANINVSSLKKEKEKIRLNNVTPGLNNKGEVLNNPKTIVKNVFPDPSRSLLKVAENNNYNNPKQDIVLAYHLKPLILLNAKTIPNKYAFVVNPDSRVKKVKQSNSFYIPLDALSLKVSVSPWIQYGKHDYWSGLNPSLGIEYERNGNNPFYSWSIGLNYFEVSKVPLQLSRSETSLGYGYESTITTVNTDHMHFLSLPVMVSHRFKDRFQLGAGLGVSYLVTASNTVTQTRETNFTSELLSSEKSNGYVQGFQSINYFSLIESRYWINPSFSVGAKYQYGLSDISINDEFGDVLKHSNSKIEFSLKYIMR